MTTDKVQSARDVIDGFLEKKAQDKDLDTATVTTIRDLRLEEKLSKTSLLRRLESDRKAALQVTKGSTEESSDGPT